jgi:4-hydroxy-tetrahydrodipicolinate synthase
VFTRVGVALVTLFDDDGALDAPATARLASVLVDAGVQAVVVAGTTGEAAALDREERVELLRAVRAGLPATPVIAGTGAPSARQAVRLTRDAQRALSEPNRASRGRFHAALKESIAERFGISAVVRAAG